MIRVLVADDHTIVRESLVNLLNQSGECLVVGEASDGLEALRKAHELQPDIAILDISMPGLNGIEIARRLTRELPRVRILMLTMHEEEEYVLHVIKAGAAGYLVKDSTTKELVAAVRALHAGQGYFTPTAARIVAEQIHDPQRNLDDPYGNLTPREREVFHLVIEGKTTKQVAANLGISGKTAENHRGHVLEKLGAKNTTDLVRYAVRKGLLD